MAFVAIGKSGDIAPGAGRCFKVAGKAIAVFNVDGQFFAIDDTCPHKGAPLSTGMVTATDVTCPWHGASFELATGNGLAGPCGGGLNVYAVRLSGDDIELDV